ncbi:hypothetical protein GGQ80_002309 [Sphingomonas jinjuensis]|uniref:Endonuclease GajA/Old nuclease/RecF-like AAA domain-containing protein n=1 Tax=Sphingomonas jinjuensis TaxID=535907 RepID=A0A840FDT8_9SPHN|nr:AAA family ATPase [Sphingomonas jinjuensis]MBB4154396.1 hypothetical protein [Sphingomonas jinjuensis]
MISRISIRNFRSIASADVDANWITTLVGANDAGKSNVLRALNLFFNGRTTADEPFEFARDYNQFAAVRQRKAPQIEVTIIFDLPEGYHRDDLPTQVEWRKVWRRGGEVRDLEQRRFVGGAEFPPRSRIPALLDRVQFTYIPAIKDKAFFADLQGRLYDVLSSVAEQPLKDSAGAFQAQLGEQLQELLDTLQGTFGAEATMRLPENLREIFENLEINSGEVPLPRRGDGIKIRHIPMMLRFIAEKRDTLMSQGGVRYTHLWGFEEPENNVEMSAAFKMGNGFVDLIADSDRFQLFVTTHSPIFYRLDRQRPEAAGWITSHFVSKDGHETVIQTRAHDDVDESMGLMPIVAPYVAEAKKRFDDMEAQLAAVRDIAAQRRPTIFIEGESDRVVLTRAWEVFADVQLERVNICAGDGAYGGASALGSRALAWMLTLRHRPTADRVRAAALFDADASGIAARRSLGDEMTRLDLGHLGLRVFQLDMPVRLRHLARMGFNIPVDLEAMYTDVVWDRAGQREWLEDRGNLGQPLTQRLIERMAAGAPNPFAALIPEDARRLQRTFNDRGKRAASRMIANLRDEAAEAELEAFRPTITSLVSHLFPPAARAQQASTEPAAEAEGSN